MNHLLLTGITYNLTTIVVILNKKSKNKLVFSELMSTIAMWLP